MPVKPTAPIARASSDPARSPSSQELYVADALPRPPAAPRKPTVEAFESLDVVDDPPSALIDSDEEQYNVVEPLPRRPSSPRYPAPEKVWIDHDKKKRPRSKGNRFAGIPRWAYATVATVFVALPVFGLTAFLMSGKSAKPGPDVSSIAAEETEEVPPSPPSPRYFGGPAAPPVVVAKASTAPAKAIAPPSPVTPPPAARQPRRVMTTAEIVAECEPSICQVVGTHKFGTGFLVGKDIVATNAHVIEDENIDEIEVRFPSAPGPKRGPFAAKLMYQDADRDVAFLAVETALPPLRVAESYKFLKGEDVTVIGSPGLGEGGFLVLENAVSRGVVSSKVQLNGFEFLQLGISINHGNSGGPVLDSHGEVIGIATAVASKQEGLAFCVPVEALHDSLASAVSGKPSPPRTRIAKAPPRPTPAPTPDAAPAPAPARSKSSKPGAPLAPGRLRPGVQAAPELVYGWVPGETYVYQFRVVYNFGPQSAVLEGTSFYRAREGDGDGVLMTHGGWIIGRVRTADGKQVDGTVNGPTAADLTNMKVGRKGDIFDSDPKNPLPLLGDLSMFLIGPLPDGPELSWGEAREISLDSITRIQTPGGGGLQMPPIGHRPGLGGGSRSRLRSRGRASARPSLRDRMQQQRNSAPAPGQEKVIVVSHPGQEVTSYAVKSVTRSAVTIASRYQLTTAEKVDGQPQFTIDGSGTLTFDINTNLPTTYEYRAKITEINSNVTVRIPVSVSFRLLKGADRALAMRLPTMPPTPMNPCSAADVQKALDGLKLPDGGPRRDAAEMLASFAPIDKSRRAVMKALEPVLKSSDAAIRSSAYRAIGVWGAPENIDILLAHAESEQDQFGKGALIEAMGRLQPAPKSFPVLIAALGKNQGAERALTAAGPAAEEALTRAVMNPEADPQARVGACGVLRDIGGPSCVPMLESLIAMRDEGEIGRIAADAVKRIEVRCPDEDELMLMIADLSNPDGGRVFQTAERFIVTQPVEAHRAEVARKLEAAGGISDDRMWQTCLRALAAWGDAQTVPFVFARLNDPNFRPRREAIDAVLALSPGDPRLAAAIAVGFDRDPRSSLEALEAIGPGAEPELIKILGVPGRPGFNPKDIVNVLGRIGTKACIPALEKAKAASTDPFLKSDADKAIAAIGARGGDNDQWLKLTLAGLKSKDDQRRREGIGRLAATPPAGRPTAEVSQALRLSLDDPDGFSRESFLKAVGLWGDASIIDEVAKRAARPDYWRWELALPIIVKARPDDAATIDLVCARALGEQGNAADPALMLLGARAEPKLMAAATGRGTKLERVQACRALSVVGTRKSLAALQGLAKLAVAEQLANVATEALNAIKARQ